MNTSLNTKLFLETKRPIFSVQEKYEFEIKKKNELDKIRQLMKNEFSIANKVDIDGSKNFEDKLVYYINELN